jgi:hypothetical protein
MIDLIDGSSILPKKKIQCPRVLLSRENMRDKAKKILEQESIDPISVEKSLRMQDG